MTQFRTLTLFDCPHLHMDHICYDSVEDFSYHHHDICELLFLLKGDAFYSNEGRVYTLKKNSLVFIAKRTTDLCRRFLFWFYRFLPKTTAVRAGR